MELGGGYSLLLLDLLDILKTVTNYFYLLNPLLLVLGLGMILYRSHQDFPNYAMVVTE